LTSTRRRSGPGPGCVMLRRSRTIVATRSTPSRASSRLRRTSGSAVVSGIRSSSTSRLLRTKQSGLLISWATVAASVPSAANRSERSSWA
jgi:hypothetical protein